MPITRRSPTPSLNLLKRGGSIRGGILSPTAPDGTRHLARASISRANRSDARDLIYSEVNQLHAIRPRCAGHEGTAMTDEDQQYPRSRRHRPGDQPLTSHRGIDLPPEHLPQCSAIFPVIPCFIPDAFRKGKGDGVAVFTTHLTHLTTPGTGN